MTSVRIRLLIGVGLLLAALTLGAFPAWALMAVDSPLMILPGQAGRDLDGLRGADGRFTVFYAGAGTVAGSGRVAWVTGLTGNGSPGVSAGLLPPGRSGEVRAYGPAALLLPGDARPAVAWVEWLDNSCRLYCSRPAADAGGWTAAEPVLPEAVDLIRFLDGAGRWLVWVQSRSRTDDIIACRRGPNGWEPPIRVSLGDDSEDLSPRVAIHPSGAPWVVWAGALDGGRDEILLSRLRGGKWIKERLVSKEDDTPDVLPDLAISPQGLACAVWLGYARETRDYRVTTSCSTDGETWSDEIRLGQGSFARPPRLSLLDDGRFLLVWSDASGVLWQAVQDEAGWSGPRKIRPRGGDHAAIRAASLLLIHRPKASGGGLVAIPHPLP